MDLPAITPKDLEDLRFIVAHADLVGMSFVRHERDVYELQIAAARAKGRAPRESCLKIETRQAFERLPNLILAAMRRHPAGVMIARGDLAVECGYERMAEVQEEMLWICEAAHMPVIWATQVLESLAKTGQPSRAEITDAAMGERAECVMLNKGPHIVEAIIALDNILRRMQGPSDQEKLALAPPAFERGSGIGRAKLIAHAGKECETLLPIESRFIRRSGFGVRAAPAPRATRKESRVWRSSPAPARPRPRLNAPVSLKWRTPESSRARLRVRFGGTPGG